MTWFRLDDSFALHPKVITAGNAAVGLWVRCCAWSCAQLTDGIIPTAVARTLGTAKEAAALEAAGLWCRDGDRWVIPDWLDYQPPAAAVREAQRVRSEAKQRAGRLGGLRSGEARAKQERSRSEAEGQQTGSETEAPNPNPNPSQLTDSPPPPESVRAAPPGGGGGGGRDPFSAAVELVVDAEQARERNHIERPQRWRAVVAQRIRAHHGDMIRAALAEGCTPEQAAAHVLDPEPFAPPRPDPAEANARSMVAGLLLTGTPPDDAWHQALGSHPAHATAIADELERRTGWTAPDSPTATVTPIRGAQ